MTSFLFFLLLSSLTALTFAASPKKCYHCVPAGLKHNFTDKLINILTLADPNANPNITHKIAHEYYKDVQECSGDDKDKEKVCGDLDTKAWAALLNLSGIDNPAAGVKYTKRRRRGEGETPGSGVERNPTDSESQNNQVKNSKGGGGLKTCFHPDNYPTSIFRFLNEEDNEGEYSGDGRWYDNPIFSCQASSFSCLKIDKKGKKFKACVPFKLVGCQETEDTTLCGCQEDLCNRGASQRRTLISGAIGSALFTLFLWKYVSRV